MAKEAGTNVLLQVSDGGSPTSFATVAGQQNTEWVPDTTTDDTTDKSNNGWGSALNVLHSGVVRVQGKADWPDTTGLEVIRAAWDARTTVEAKIILNSAGAHYRGSWHVTGFNVRGTHLNATEYDIELRNEGGLTYAAS